MFATRKPPAPVAPSRIGPVLAQDSPFVLVVAHRGVFDRAPENSLAALELAVSVGADLMELDTRTTADDTLIVLHDETLDRTTTASGPVRALADGALAGLRLRAGAGGRDAAPTNERLPRLAEMLEAARGRIFLNIDTKTHRDLPAVGRLVRDMGMMDEVVLKFEVDPFCTRHPVEDMGFFGRIPFMPVFRQEDGRARAQVEAVARIRPPMIECRFDSLDALRASRSAREAAGIRLWVNSLDGSHDLDLNDSRALADPQSVWGALLEAGVGAIQTDRAEALIAWLGARHASAAR